MLVQIVAAVRVDHGLPLVISLSTHVYKPRNKLRNICTIAVDCGVLQSYLTASKRLCNFHVFLFYRSTFNRYKCSKMEMYFENKKLYKKYNAWLPHVGEADGTG